MENEKGRQWAPLEILPGPNSGSGAMVVAACRFLARTLDRLLGGILREVLGLGLNTQGLSHGMVEEFFDVPLAHPVVPSLRGPQAAGRQYERHVRALGCTAKKLF